MNKMPEEKEGELVIVLNGDPGDIGFEELRKKIHEASSGIEKGVYEVRFKGDITDVENYFSRLLQEDSVKAHGESSRMISEMDIIGNEIGAINWSVGKYEQRRTIYFEIDRRNQQT